MHVVVQDPTLVVCASHECFGLFLHADIEGLVVDVLEAAFDHCIFLLLCLKYTSSRKMAHKARKFFRPFFCHFYSWPPFFYLAAYFYLTTIVCLPTSETMAHKARKIFRPFFCHFFPGLLFLPGLLFFYLVTSETTAHKARNFFRPFFCHFYS